MSYENKLIDSYYKIVDTINDEHHVYLTKHTETGEFFIKKILDIYNKDVYEHIKQNPIKGLPTIYEVFDTPITDSQTDDTKNDYHRHTLTVIEEYICGQSLTSKINSGTLSLDELIYYSVKLCDILISLHNRRPPIVHRDIKPDNVIIRPDGTVVLIDLNGAKFLDHSITKDTILFGTQDYAAPENYGFGSSTPQTDIYSLGMTIKAMLLHFNNSIDMSDLKTDDKRKLEIINKIIEKCTQIDPKNRYSNVTELKEMLANTNTISGQKGSCNRVLADSCSVSQSHAYKYSYSGYQKFLPPGFRSGNIKNMVISIIFYLIIANMTHYYINLDYEGDEITKLMPYVALTAFFTQIYVVVCFFNYLNIWKLMPLCKSESAIIRFIGKLILYLIMTCVTFFLIVFLACS